MNTPEETKQIKGLPDQPKTESEKLKARAADLTILAIISLGLAAGCIAFGLSEQPIEWIWLYVGGSLCSTAILFFFFAQLFHIRALLAKK